MKKVMRLMFVPMLMILAAPAWSDSFSYAYKCEQQEGASDKDLMAGGSVSVSGEGIDDENITFRMENEEGWIYFYIYNGLRTLENFANYTFKVSSHHLNYQFPDSNVPTID